MNDVNRSILINMKDNPEYGKEMREKYKKRLIQEVMDSEHAVLFSFKKGNIQIMGGMYLQKDVINSFIGAMKEWLCSVKKQYEKYQSSANNYQI